MQRSSGFFMLFSLFALSLTVSGSEIDIDLIDFKLNGQPLIQMDLDTITDTLGRPERVHSAEDGLYNNTVSYTSKGLYFVLWKSKVDTNERVHFVHIYLTPQSRLGDFSDKAPLGFSAFRGALTKGLNESWKLKTFLNEFSDSKAIDESDDAKIMEAAEKIKT